MFRKHGGQTYRAARVIGGGLRVEPSTLIPARSAEVVTLDLDVEVELLVGGGAVLENREPLAVVLTNTQVDRSPVANGLAAITPLARLLGRDTLGVDIVLGRSGLALPFVVLLAIGAGQGLDIGTGLEGDGLGFGTWMEKLDTRHRRDAGSSLTRVVSTANSDLLRQSVLDVDTANTFNAKLAGEILVGEVELSEFALQATDGLAGRALGCGPLRLLVASRAGIGAHGAVVAVVTGDGSRDVTDHLVQDGDILDTRPTTEAEVVKRDSTVFRRESATVDLAIWEVPVQTLAAGGAAGAGRRSRGGRRACAGGGRRSGGRRGHGRRGRLLKEGSRGGGWGRGGSRHGAGGLASTHGSLAISPQQGAVLDALANFGGGDGLAIELIFEDRVATGNHMAAPVEVTVLVVMGLGRGEAGGGQGDGNSAEFHCVQDSGTRCES